MKPSAAYAALSAARSEGVTLRLEGGSGTIKVVVPRGRLDHWLTILRKHKPELLVLLAAMPALVGRE